MNLEFLQFQLLKKFKYILMQFKDLTRIFEHYLDIVGYAIANPPYACYLFYPQRSKKLSWIL